MFSVVVKLGWFEKIMHFEGLVKFTHDQVVLNKNKFFWARFYQIKGAFAKSFNCIYLSAGKYLKILIPKFYLILMSPLEVMCVHVFKFLYEPLSGLCLAQYVCLGYSQLWFQFLKIVFVVEFIIIHVIEYPCTVCA